MPDAGASQKAGSKAFQNVELRKFGARDRSKQQNSRRFDNPEQVEYEYRSEAVVEQYNCAALGKVPLINIGVVKPEQECDIREAEDQRGVPLFLLRGGG